MTEKTTTKGPVRQLSDCAGLAGFDAAGGWPEALPIECTINLLAGTRKHSDEGRKGWARPVSSAIERGELVAIEKWETFAPPVFVRYESTPPAGEYPIDNIAPQPVMPQSERARQYVTRTALAAWLQFIGETTETLSACALAWMGDEWKEVPGAGAEPSPTIERRKRAALIKELEGRWPSIKNDLRRSFPGDKGLHDAAKLPEHGYWNKITALQWAEENGKLVDSVPKPQGFAAPRTVKLQ